MSILGKEIGKSELTFMRADSQLMALTPAADGTDGKTPAGALPMVSINSNGALKNHYHPIALKNYHR